MNAGKKKIMQCRVNMFQSEDSGEYPCGVCRKAVIVYIFLAILRGNYKKSFIIIIFV